jgi:hypothetical protein
VLPLDFTWTAPDTCPTRAEVVEQLSQAVDAGGKELPPLSARAVVTQDGQSWRLQLETEMDGRRGTRLLEADSCEGLSRAATLVLALTLGEGLARRQAEDEARATTPPAPTPPPPPPKPVATAEPAEPATLQLRAAAALGTDALGVLGPGWAIGAAYQRALLRVGVKWAGTLPRSTALTDPGVDVRTFGMSFGLEACLAPTLQPLALAVCAEGGLTLLQAKGSGSARDERATLPLSHLGPSVGAQWLLGERAFIGLGLVSHFYLKRPLLLVQGSPSRRRVETASVSAELGGGVRF